MRTCRTDAGFTLLEVVCCVAVLAIGIAGTLGAVAAVVRNAENGATRDVALMVAENALARARAAALYVPAAQPSPDAAVANASWALRSSASYTAGATVLGPALCGSGTATFALAVSTTYGAASNAFTVTVTYPQNPCSPSGPATSVTLTQTLPTPHYAPGTQLVRTIAPPANM